MRRTSIRKIMINSVALFISLFFSTTFAEFYNYHSGFYLGGNLGVGLKSNSTSGVAAAISIGRLFNPFIAIEGGYAYYGSADGTSVLNVVAKGVLPVSTRGTLFAKLGVGYIELRNCFLGCTTHNQFGPAFGLGGGVNINNQWQTSLEYNGVYTTFTNNSGFVGGITLGVTRYFDA